MLLEYDLEIFYYIVNSIDSLYTNYFHKHTNTNKIPYKNTSNINIWQTMRDSPFFVNKSSIVTQRAESIMISAQGKFKLFII